MILRTEPKPLLRQAYGLVFDGGLDLPELLPASDSAAPDVRIRFGDCPRPEQQADGRQLGPYLWTGPQWFSLEVPEVARFWISGGSDILIEPAPGIDEDSVRVFLLGSGLGALLFQRGLLVLHGNAIQVGEQCMICVGHSGAGKSTLAAEFLRRGHAILADDVVPIDRECRALPGFPRIKLWQDTASQMQIDTASLRRIRPGMEKFNYPVGGAFADRPLPVRWVYILRGDKEPDIELAPLHGMERFLPLRHNTYRISYLDGMGLKAEHLGLVSKLGARIRLVQVRRPDRGFGVEALADRLLADIAENP